MTISARSPYSKEETHNVSEVNRFYSNPFTLNSYRLQKQSSPPPPLTNPYIFNVTSCHISSLNPPVNVGQNFYFELHSIVVGWNEFLSTQINTAFPRISAHALISAIHLKKGSPLGQVSNKRPSRISAASLPITFLNIKETRNTSFYYHFIYNFLSFNFYIHTEEIHLCVKWTKGLWYAWLSIMHCINKRKTLISTFIYVDNVAVFVFLLKT